MKTRKNNKKLELQYNTAEVLVPSLVLLGFLLLIIFGVTGILNKIFNKPEEIDIEAEIWEQSFREAEKNRVGIDFESISTNNREYKQMQDVALSFARQEYGIDEADTQVEVSTVVDETLYVDGLDNNAVNSQQVNVNKDMRETGPIYFNNMLMLRYITEDGLMRVIISIKDETGNEIKATKQSELIDLARQMNRDNEIVTGDIDKDLINRLLNNKNDVLIHEQEYLLGLADSTIELLKTQSSSNVRDAEQKAIKYYTVEGKQTVYGSKKDIPIEEDSEVDLIYIAAGKSDTSKSTKDRIYMQLLITHKDAEDEKVFIILKLNSNIRVFDIDIV